MLAFAGECPGGGFARQRVAPITFMESRVQTGPLEQLIRFLGIAKRWGTPTPPSTRCISGVGE